MDIRVNGVVVFWRAGESSRAKLREGLDAIGWSKYLPEPKTPYAALLEAARAVYSAAEYMHIGTEKNGGVEIVQVVKGQDRNNYGHVDTVAVDKSGNLLPCLDQERLTAEYTQARANLPATAITALLVNAVYALRGVTLRPGGGFYWVTNERREELQRVITAVQSAEVIPGTTHVYQMSVAHDGESVAAIVDAATAEVDAEIARMAADLRRTGEDALGKRALRTREETAIALAQKVQTLAGVLGVALDGLTTKLNAVRVAAADAIIAASAEEIKPVADGIATGAMFGSPV